MKRIKSYIPLALAVALLIGIGVAYAQATHTVTLTWAAGVCGVTPGCTTGTGFNVYRATTAGGPYTKQNATPLSAATLTFTDGAVSNGTTYFYIVRSVDAGGLESINSNEANAAIPGQPPPPSGCSAKVN
jgi:hypothetical protein